MAEKGKWIHKTRGEFERDVKRAVNYARMSEGELATVVQKDFGGDYKKIGRAHV
mgnify:CR=1 FL=1